jgi:hypothetical protein
MVHHTSGERRKGMLPDGKYITEEDAAKQIKVAPITFRRWLAVGTMPQFEIEGTDCVLQSDVDDFIESIQCRSQRKLSEPKLAKAAVS